MKYLLKHLYQAAILFALVIFLAFSNNTQSYAASFERPDSVVQKEETKMIPIKTPHGTFKVWTKRIGDNPKIKVLIIAGGPGIPHDYLQCFENFLPKEGIELIYYDQLGVGSSENPNDTTLFKLDRVVDEVEQVRVAMHLNKENLYLYGQSWGGVVAMEYALKYQHNLKALIISNMVSSADAYNTYGSLLEKEMPGPILDSVRKIEATKDFQNPKYSDLLMQSYIPEHVLRLPLDKWPEPVTHALAKPNFDYARIILGLDQFTIGGELTHWNIDSRISGIRVPTLIIGAKYDFMNPAHMEWMSTKVANGSYLYCPNGSHFCFYDDQQVYMNGIIKYIKEIDKGTKRVFFN